MGIDRNMALVAIGFSVGVIYNTACNNKSPLDAQAADSASGSDNTDGDGNNVTGDDCDDCDNGVSRWITYEYTCTEADHEADQASMDIEPGWAFFTWMYKPKEADTWTAVYPDGYCDPDDTYTHAVCPDTWLLNRYCYDVGHPGDQSRLYVAYIHA